MGFKLRKLHYNRLDLRCDCCGGFVHLCDISDMFFMGCEYCLKVAIGYYEKRENIGGFMNSDQCFWMLEKLSPRCEGQCEIDPEVPPNSQRRFVYNYKEEKFFFVDYSGPKPEVTCYKVPFIEFTAPTEEL